MSNQHFATFWHGGELSSMEQACLGSFVSYGYHVDLYSFMPMQALPDGVTQCDAADIVEPKTLEGFIVEGKPDIAHFSDYFRLKLFQARQVVWIDSDLVCLRPIIEHLPDTLLVREQQDSLCNAIMRIDSDDACLPVLISRTEALLGKPIPWGATGPRLLTDYFGHSALMTKAEAPARFFPIHYTEFWKVFHPAFIEECLQLCDHADTLHLWNNLVVRAGIWKKFGPPRGSYLAETFEKADCLRYFPELYPAEVMTRAIENYIARDGADLGLKRMARLLVPSLRNTMRRRVSGDDTSFLRHLPSMSRQLQAAAGGRKP